MPLRNWVRLPSDWIQQGGLTRWDWDSDGSDATSGLMILLALAHHAIEETGRVRMTYSDLRRATGLSRTMIAGGLPLLTRRARGCRTQ
jgi:hypothetical protein